MSTKFSRTETIECKKIQTRVNVIYTRPELLNHLGQVQVEEHRAHQCSGAKICGTFELSNNLLPNREQLVFIPNYQCPIFK